MLHHHQRVAFVTEQVQGVQQDLVVTRMQTNGGLVQHVAHALQVAAQLCGQTNALRLTAAERGRATVEREVVQAHLLQELQAALDFGYQVARDVRITAAHGELLDPFANLGHAQACNVGDAHPRKLHRACGGVQAGAVAGGASHVHQVVHIGFGKGLLTSLVFVVTHRVVQHLALVLVELHACTHAVGAPAVFAVVREQAWVQLGIRGVAHRAGALGGVHIQAANAVGVRAGFHRLTQAVQLAQHMDHAFTVLERRRQRLAQRGFVLW